MVLGLCVQAILVMNWMNSKFDTHRELIDEKHNKAEASFVGLHQRINKVKDDYVKKVDLDKDLNRLQQSLVDIKIDIHKETSEMNSRLDRLIKILLEQKGG